MKLPTFSFSLGQTARQKQRISADTLLVGGRLSANQARIVAALANSSKARTARETFLKAYKERLDHKAWLDQLGSERPDQPPAQQPEETPKLVARGVLKVTVSKQAADQLKALRENRLEMFKIKKITRDSIPPSRVEWLQLGFGLSIDAKEGALVARYRIPESPVVVVSNESKTQSNLRHLLYVEQRGRP